MPERSEEQKLIQDPIRVTLGGTEYSVPLLKIKDSRAWRREVAQALGLVSKHLGVTSDKPEAFSDALTSMLGIMPDMVIDLFFSYARTLNREEIEAMATEQEVAVAFREVTAVAFPLLPSLIGSMTKLNP